MHGQKKGRQWKNCLPERSTDGLDVGLGFAQTLNPVTGFPLTAFLEQVDTFEAFQNVAFHDETGGALEAFVL